MGTFSKHPTIKSERYQVFVCNNTFIILFKTYSKWQCYESIAKNFDKIRNKHDIYKRLLALASTVGIYNTVDV